MNLHDKVMRRAKVFGLTRAFFSRQGSIEVDVPVLAKHTVTDRFIESLEVKAPSQKTSVGFLQTSPEYQLKRLIAQGLRNHYYLGKAFRAEEQGLRHLNEFTVCEWYMVQTGNEEISVERIADQAIALIHYIQTGLKESRIPTCLNIDDHQVRHVSYASLFLEKTGCDLDRRFTESDVVLDELRLFAKRNCHYEACKRGSSADELCELLDLIFGMFIEPSLKGLTVVNKYPVEMSALAKISLDKDGHAFAQRAEIFANGLELANAYHELGDAKELKTRFEKDNTFRKKIGRPLIGIDRAFIEAHQRGLPECAGIALGLDRLMMCLFGEADIMKVQNLQF